MIRILLAEDMHMIRGALAALLGLEADMEVVAEVDRGTRSSPPPWPTDPPSPSSTWRCPVRTVCRPPGTSPSRFPNAGS